MPDSDEGITFVAFLVRTDGTVGRSVIVNSSGFKEQDRAAAEAGSACLYKPATDAGKVVEAWAPVKYVWKIDGDPGMTHAKRTAATAASKGDLAARYQLSLLMSVTAKNDADRQQALTVLRSAAELGYAPAQFELGRHLENGKGMNADIEAALLWYRKAAAQGDVLANQRLRVGALPD